MKALVYHGLGSKSLDEVARPSIAEPGDALVRVTHTTICGTDLHILKGDVPTCTPGRFSLADAMTAYDVFTRAAETGALKIITP